MCAKQYTTMIILWIINSRTNPSCVCHRPPLCIPSASPSPHSSDGCGFRQIFPMYQYAPSRTRRMHSSSWHLTNESIIGCVRSANLSHMHARAETQYQSIGEANICAAEIGRERVHVDRSYCRLKWSVTVLQVSNETSVTHRITPLSVFTSTDTYIGLSYRSKNRNETHCVTVRIWKSSCGIKMHAVTAINMHHS